MSANNDELLDFDEEFFQWALDQPAFSDVSPTSVSLSEEGDEDIMNLFYDDDKASSLVGHDSGNFDSNYRSVDEDASLIETSRGVPEKKHIAKRNENRLFLLRQPVAHRPQMHPPSDTVRIDVAPLPPSHDRQSFSPSTTMRIHIGAEDITEDDILCGRESAGSNHPGNFEYLRMIDANRARYQACGSQHREKTTIRNGIVQELVDRGSRFIKVEGDRHFLLTLEEARNKTSQALREKPKRIKLHKV